MPSIIATPPSGACQTHANQHFDGVADVSSVMTAIPFNLTAASPKTVSDLTIIYHLRPAVLQTQLPMQLLL